MKSISLIKNLLSVFLIFCFSSNGILKSIPAFARKYQISCQVCHAPVMPRLKAFGEEFAANGFRMTEYESPRYFIQTGDDKLSLFREFPIGVRFDGHVKFDFRENNSPKMASPYIVKLLSGGELSDKISYYFYFLLSEEGKIVGIEDAFMMFSDLFKTGINFYIGQFQASDPLFKGELRYTLEGYKIYDSKPGNSLASLKYERGIILERSFSTGTSLIAEVLNGSGIESEEFDNDKFKNYMVRLSQEIGKNIIIGGFAYAGKEMLQDTTKVFYNKMVMYGSDFKLNINDKFALGLQYIYRTDTRVFDNEKLLDYRDIKTQGGFAELIFSPKGDMSKWYLTGLFNWVDSEYDPLDYTAATLHAGYLVRRNLRLVGEYTQPLSGEKYGKLNFGFISAF